jgi:hypothetical protein
MKQCRIQYINYIHGPLENNLVWLKCVEHSPGLVLPGVVHVEEDEGVVDDGRE